MTQPAEEALVIVGTPAGNVAGIFAGRVPTETPKVLIRYPAMLEWAGVPIPRQVVGGPPGIGVIRIIGFLPVPEVLISGPFIFECHIPEDGRSGEDYQPARDFAQAYRQMISQWATPQLAS